MKELIFYLVLFVFIYLFYIIFVYKRKNVFKKFESGKEISYLKHRYSVKVNDLNIKKIAKSIFLANSFILSTTVYVISFFDKFILQAFFGIISLVVLILILYHILGKIYGKER